MRRRRARLAGAGVLVVAAHQAEIALWSLVAPHSFYASFPGDGHHRVSALGPSTSTSSATSRTATKLGFALLLVCAEVASPASYSSWRSSRPR